MKLYTFFRSSTSYRLRIALPYPVLMKIFENCMKLPAFVDSQPSRQGDAA